MAALMRCGRGRGRVVAAGGGGRGGGEEVLVVVVIVVVVVVVVGGGIGGFGGLEVSGFRLMSVFRWSRDGGAVECGAVRWRG